MHSRNALLSLYSITKPKSLIPLANFSKKHMETTLNYNIGDTSTVSRKFCQFDGRATNGTHRRE
jgi:hypothetical protein